MHVDDMFQRLNKDKLFTLMHCFSKLQECKEWNIVRRMLNAERRSDTFAPLYVLEGHPIGNEKAKVAVSMAFCSERVYSEVDKCVAGLTASRPLGERSSTRDGR
jgi:hypothetical protein